MSHVKNRLYLASHNGKAHAAVFKDDEYQDMWGSTFPNKSVISSYPVRSFINDVELIHGNKYLLNPPKSEGKRVKKSHVWTYHENNDHGIRGFTRAGYDQDLDSVLNYDISPVHIDKATDAIANLGTKSKEATESIQKFGKAFSGTGTLEITEESKTQWEALLTNDGNVAGDDCMSALKVLLAVYGYDMVSCCLAEYDNHRYGDDVLTPNSYYRISGSEGYSIVYYYQHPEAKEWGFGFNIADGGGFVSLSDTNPGSVITPLQFNDYQPDEPQVRD